MRQVGYLQRLYRDARSTEHKKTEHKMHVLVALTETFSDSRTAQHEVNEHSRKILSVVYTSRITPAVH